MLDPCSKAGGTSRLWSVTTGAGLRAIVEPQAPSRQTTQNNNASNFSRTLYAFQYFKTFPFCPSKRRPHHNSALCPKSAVICLIKGWKHLTFAPLPSRLNRRTKIDLRFLPINNSLREEIGS